ncbi:MAG: hypothetical protein ABSA30_03825 [Candidatus Aminicenantales bacterium]
MRKRRLEGATRQAIFGFRLGFVIIVLLLPTTALSPAEKQIETKFGRSIEIGRQDLPFGSIASLCEDQEGNFFVLDEKEIKVFKFSPEGRRILTFGGKGQGPGDFQSPHLIVFTAQAEVVVLEDFLISFFKPNGAFIRRLDLNDRLGLVYVGPDRFLGWVWQPSGRQQVMLDGRNAIKATFRTQPRDSFSTSVLDQAGRAVMFNYTSDAYVPELIFGQGGGIGLAGISTLYDLTLLDEHGRVIGSVRRDLKPAKIKGGERARLEREIREFSAARNWPGGAVRELVKKIPGFKAIIRAIRVSPQAIFVFRVAQDITLEDSPIPVDVFSLRGGFMGSTNLNRVPLFVSGKAMYFVETDSSGNEYLRRCDYSLSPGGDQ